MRVECKLCKKNLTGESIKLLEGKINEVKCDCSESQARRLQKKIAKEFDLYNTKQRYLDEFDNFLNKLCKLNGTTNY